uniref:Uncharacterized protein n=1 Tax=Oryza punctata TaxID=4537 RepID=A0A0E0JDZ9_ORYPU
MARGAALVVVGAARGETRSGDGSAAGGIARAMASSGAMRRWSQACIPRLGRMKSTAPSLILLPSRHKLKPPPMQRKTNYSSQRQVTNSHQVTKNRNHEAQLIHTTYMQAVSKIIASKSTAVSITVQGKAAINDLSKLQPTQAHIVNYMKNKLPHMHIILDEENVKNNEI